MQRIPTDILRRWRAVCAGSLAGALLAGLPGAAPAFVPTQGPPPGPVASTPEPGDEVDGAGVLISLRFEAPVNHERSTLILRSRHGRRLLKPSLRADAKYLVGRAGRLEPGAYEVYWEARLAGGEVRRGTLRFTVRAPGE